MSETEVQERTESDECSPETAPDQTPPAAEEAAPSGDANPAEEGPSEAPEAESLRKIIEAEKLVALQLRLWDDAKEAAKTKKSCYDAAVHHLRKVIRTEGEEYPLFDGPPAVAEAATESPVDLDEDESWRDVPLSDVLAGLAPSITAALEAADLRTVGDLSDHLGDGKSQLTDIPAIGPVKAEKIEAALAEFWARRKAAAVPPEGLGDLDAAAADLDLDEEDDDL